VSRTLPLDPIEPGGIAGFAHRLRACEITAETATRAYLERIEILDPHLDAYECVMADKALETARAVDRLLAAGTDLGPLMGVPVSVKDLFAIKGTPTTAGSNLDLADLIGTEGSFVGTLRRAGCVILGKTRMPEFAMGSVGGHGVVSFLRGAPRNPWDAKTHRAPGASPSRPECAPFPSAPTPEARCADRRPCAASSASRQAPACGPPTACCPRPRNWTPSDQ
jgi:aspartyl-tRNA(Asn)/glutamyl-tRNA(Gln) amidotransferase subunit A